MRVRSALVVLAIVLAACSGSGSSTTAGGSAAPSTIGAVAGSTSTTLGASESTVSTVTVTVDELPAECKQAFVDFLHAIESKVDGVDVANLTTGDLDQLFTDIQPESDAFDSTMSSSGCDKYNLEVADEAAQQQLIAIAKSEAPGTVDFLTSLLAMSSAMSANNAVVSGDCDTDIATLKEIAAGGKSMSELTVTELTQVSGLMAALTDECPADQFSKLLDDPDLASLLQG
jgi:hypothetical protein